jgi:hypothetical protein
MILLQRYVLHATHAPNGLSHAANPFGQKDRSERVAVLKGRRTIRPLPRSSTCVGNLLDPKKNCRLNQLRQTNRRRDLIITEGSPVLIRISPTAHVYMDSVVAALGPMPPDSIDQADLNASSGGSRSREHFTFAQELSPVAPFCTSDSRVRPSIVSRTLRSTIFADSAQIRWKPSERWIISEFAFSDLRFDSVPRTY